MRAGLPSSGQRAFSPQRGCGACVASREGFEGRAGGPGWCLCARRARVPSCGVSRSPRRPASPTTAGGFSRSPPGAVGSRPRRVCAEPSLAHPCLCAGVLPLGSTGLASTAHAVASLRPRSLSCLASPSDVRCWRRTSARSVAAAAVDCRNAQQEEMGLPAPRRPARSWPWPRLPSSLCFALRLPLPLSAR